VVAVDKAQTLQSGRRRSNATGPLQSRNQGTNIDTAHKATQGAHGALAGLAFSVMEGLHQLGVAAIPRLSDLDECSAVCSRNTGILKLLMNKNMQQKAFFAFIQQSVISA
jgi:hypothetical protein